MAPAKIGKKKRTNGGVAHTTTNTRSHTHNAHASTSQGGSVNNTSHVISPSRSHASLTAARQFYEELLKDSTRVQRLEDIQWLHQVVIIVVVNLMMYGAEIHKHQLYTLVGSVVWLSRGMLLKYILDVEARAGQWKQFVAWRVLLLVVGAGGASYCTFLKHDGPNAKPLALVGIMAILDLASIMFTVLPVSANSLRLTQLAEVLYITTTFSTQYNDEEFLIYDHLAIGLAIMTTAVQFVVCQGVVSAVLRLPWLDETLSTRNQAARMDALDEIRVSVIPSRSGKATKTKHNQPHDASEPNLLHGLQGQLSLWLALQTALVLSHLVCDMFVFDSWELGSIVTLTSVHLLVELLRIRRDVASEPPKCLTVEDATK